MATPHTPYPNTMAPWAALAAAALFGASTPLAKLLLAQVSPWLLAALLYLGSGVGLYLVRLVRRAPPVRLAVGEWRWLGGAIVCGGVAAPVLLMLGLAHMPASGAALLLNAEGVFTALVAWLVFKENVDRRIALGMLAIVVGALVLSWPTSGAVQMGLVWPTLAVLGACLGWAIDNNLTRKVAQTDATWLAMVKGLCAGSANLVLAVALGATWPGAATVLGAAVLGLLSYGVSLVLFVVALRHLGSARTGAYFSVAPFFGAVLALLVLQEPLTPSLLVCGAFMALGVVLHLRERHEHMHTHDDPHHPITHSHAHYPDAQHQHKH